MKEKEVVVEKEWQQFQTNSSSRSKSKSSTVDTMSVSINRLVVIYILAKQPNKGYCIYLCPQGKRTESFLETN